MPAISIVSPELQEITEQNIGKKVLHKDMEELVKGDIIKNIRKVIQTK